MRTYVVRAMIPAGTRLFSPSAARLTDPALVTLTQPQPVSAIGTCRDARQAMAGLTATIRVTYGPHAAAAVILTGVTADDERSSQAVPPPRCPE